MIAIVQNSDLQIVNKYEGETPDQARFGGVWGSPMVTTHVLISPLLDPDCVKAVRDENGVILIQEDQDLVDAKTERLWMELRGQRNMRLSECDWTQIVDAPINAQDKAAWAAYRQELRDLPENLQDPREVVWPTKPNTQI